MSQFTKARQTSNLTSFPRDPAKYELNNNFNKPQCKPQT
uniref:Uncharacterized protein n=1 Tax=Arundo donax TaxID=35708 RepID=A0A0A9HBE2_ARUDO